MYTINKNKKYSINLLLFFFAFPYQLFGVNHRNAQLLLNISCIPFTYTSYHSVIFVHCLGFPVFLFPPTYISFDYLTASLSGLLKTSLNHLNLFYRVLPTIKATPILPHVYQFHIQSFRVTPLIYLSTLISATLVLCYNSLPSVEQYEPYIIAGIGIAL